MHPFPRHLAVHALSNLHAFLHPSVLLHNDDHKGGEEDVWKDLLCCDKCTLRHTRDRCRRRRLREG